MTKRLNIEMTDELEATLTELRNSIPADDVYLYMFYLLNTMSAFVDTVYFRDSELYTGICLDEEELLVFLNFLASYQSLIQSYH